MTHYETLQVSETASPQIIRAAFAMLQRTFHPDNKSTGDSEMSRKVNAAYQILKDPLKRAEYNKQLVRERATAPRGRVIDIGINPDAYPAAYIFDEPDLAGLASRAAMAAGSVFLNSVLDGMNPAARELFERAMRNNAAAARKAKGA